MATVAVTSTAAAEVLEASGAVASVAEVLEAAASDLDLGGGGPRGKRHGRAAEPLPPPSLSPAACGQAETSAGLLLLLLHGSSNSAPAAWKPPRRRWRCPVPAAERRQRPPGRAKAAELGVNRLDTRGGRARRQPGQGGGREEEEVGE